MVARSLERGTNVSALAREIGISPSQLFGWRSEAIKSGEVERLDEAAVPAPTSRASSMIEIAVNDMVIRVGIDLAAVERAMGLMAGYGVQLWPILQDVHQLRATYGQRAGTFLSNAGVLQVFGVNDHDSARLVSDLLGQETVVFQTMSRALDSEKTGISYGEQHTGRPLLTPDEVRNLPQHAELLFLAGKRPIIASKLAYYQDPEFKELFDAPMAV